MQEKKIKIEIDEFGKITAESFGIEGSLCVDELEIILEDFLDLQKIKKKPEYYKKPQIKNLIQQKKI